MEFVDPDERVAWMTAELSVDSLMTLEQSLASCLRELEAEVLVLRERGHQSEHREPDMRRVERRVGQLHALMALLLQMGTELGEAVASLPCCSE